MIQPGFLTGKSDSPGGLPGKPTHGPGPIYILLPHDDLIGRKEHHFIQMVRGPLVQRIKMADGFDPITPEFQAQGLDIQGGEYIDNTTSY